MTGFVDANASRLTERLLVGGDLDLLDLAKARRQLAELLDAGLTHVVDCRIEWSDAEVWERVGVRYVHAPLDDVGQTVPPDWFERHVGAVLGFLEEPESSVLVHCHMGVNRGPSLAFAVLLALGWAPVDALARLQQVRPVAYAYYAEDALDWWAARAGWDEETTRRHRDALAQHRARHPLDVRHVIADLRSAERDAGITSWDG